MVPRKGRGEVMLGTGDTPSLLAQGIALALLLAILAFPLWRREWTRLGLAFGLCIGFAAWFHAGFALDLLLARLPQSSQGSSVAGAGWGALAWPLLRAGLYLGAMAACLRQARLLRTVLIVAVCLAILFTSTIPVIRWLIGLDPMDVMAMRGLDLPAWLNLIAAIAIGLVPIALAVPWAIHRQSRSRHGLMSPILDRLALNSGFALVAFALICAAIMSGFPPVFVLILLVGTGLAAFWALRRAFIEPAVALIEAVRGVDPSATGDSTLISRLPAIWQPLFQSIESDRQSAREHLKELETTRAHLRSFFEYSPVALTLMERDGKVSVANSKAAEPYGAGIDEFLTMDLTQMAQFWPELDTLVAGFHQVIETGEPRRLSAPFRHPESGEVRLFDYVMFPVLQGEEVSKVGHIAIDVTDHSQAEAALAEREAQLTGFFNHAPVNIGIGGIDGRFIMANPAVADEYGRSYDELMALTPEESLAAWADAKAMSAAMIEVMKGGKSQRLITPFRPGPDAPEKVFDVTIFPILGADGKVAQIGTLGIDVTAQAQAREELNRSRGTIQAFFENIPAMTFIIGPDRRYVSANSYAIDNYGFEFLRPENLVGQSDLTGTPDQWHPVIAEAHRTVMEDGKPHEVETSIDMPGGTISLYVSRFPIRNAEGEVTHVGGLIFDRSAERRASDQVAATREALHQSEKLAALGQLLAGVAHELNNPLTVVVGRSAILEEKLRESPHAKAVADLREAADRCNRIVRTFLAMARQSAPRRAAVQVNDAIEAALDMTTYGLRSSGIELVRRFDANLPEVEADEDQLVQVFTNLLINARHALEEHRPEGGRVAITTRTQAGKLLVEFADNGPGVPAEIVSRIFEPFFTTKAVGDGTGMGLAMSRGMIEEHGGLLRYGDGQGGGAVFTVELPIPATLTDALPAGDTQPQHASGRGRVLVVDDEPTIRGLLVEILEGVELDCTECGDGAAALDLLDRQSFDLVFCDVRMPVMDGIRFRQQVAEAHPDMLERLIFISGDVLQRGNARRAEIASHAFVEKPFNPVEVRRLALNLLDAQGATP